MQLATLAFECLSPQTSGLKLIPEQDECLLTRALRKQHEQELREKEMREREQEASKLAKRFASRVGGNAQKDKGEEKSKDTNSMPNSIPDYDLKLQNMLYAPEVQTSLRTLRISAVVACDKKVLAAVAETANEETLATDTVEVIVGAAWLQLRAVTAIDSGLDALALACLCLATSRCGPGPDNEPQEANVYAQPGPEMLGAASTDDLASGTL